MMTMLGLCLASLTSSRCSICILSVGGFHKFSLFLFGINKKNMMCEKGASGVWRLLTIESLQTSVAWVFISIRLSLRKFAIMDHEGILNRPLTKRLSVSSQKIIHFTVMPLQFLALITSLVAQLCYFSRAWDRTVVLQSSASPSSSHTICRRWFSIKRWRPEIIFCKTTDRHFCVTRMNKVLKFYLNARNYGHRFIGKASRSIVTKQPSWPIARLCMNTLWK